MSSDDDEEEDSGSTRRMESISPRPADSARSSPAPSTGKVEAALKENSCGIEQRIGSITTDTEIAVTLPRKARMKDQVLFNALFKENRNQIINGKCKGLSCIVSN